MEYAAYGLRIHIVIERGCGVAIYSKNFFFWYFNGFTFHILVFTVQCTRIKFLTEWKWSLQKTGKHLMQQSLSRLYETCKTFVVRFKLSLCELNERVEYCDWINHKKLYIMNGEVFNLQICENFCHEFLSDFEIYRHKS